jgi:hypothetical protein
MGTDTILRIQEDANSVNGVSPRRPVMQRSSRALVYHEFFRMFRQMMQSTISLPQPTAQKEQIKRSFFLGCIIILWILFLGLNLRHLFEPFQDYGKPLAGEPYYAIRSLNYLRHGYFSHWLGVCDNLIPHPEQLRFKFTEMPAFFVVNALVFQTVGASDSAFRLVELAYALCLFVSFSLAVWKLFDPKTALAASLIFLLFPANIFLLYISWSFLFPMLALLFYSVWLKERCRISLSLLVISSLLGCLHHIAGFFLAPALLIHAALTRSIRKNAKGLLAVSAGEGIVGILYLGQIFMLRQNLEAVGAKAFSESVINIGYLRAFFGLNMQKLTANYYELLTVPVLALALWWVVKKIRRRADLSQGDHFIFLTLIFSSLFFLVFLGMVGSHLHFLTFFGPFLALSAARVLLEIRLKWVRAAGMIILPLYLAFDVYHVQHKYDLLLWNKENTRGYMLARSLRKLTDEAETIGGTPVFGHNFSALSPAFFFYLQRDYYGDITSLDDFMDTAKTKKFAVFVLPTTASKRAETQSLARYLSEHHPHFVEPDRPDVMIFDLRTLERE